MPIRAESIHSVSQREARFGRVALARGVTLLAAGLCACTTAGPFSPTVSLVPDMDAASATVAASKSAPATVASSACVTLPSRTVRTTANNMNADDLSADFDAVRTELGMAPVELDPDVYAIKSSELLKEVQRLRAAKGAKKGAAAGAQVPALDAVETVLVAKLPPWVGDGNVTIPGLIAALNTTASATESASGSANGFANGSVNDPPVNKQPAVAQAIQATADALQLATAKASPLNALVNAAQQQPVKNANASSSTFSRSDHFRLFSDLQTLEVLRTFHFMTLLSAVRLHQMMTSGTPIDDAQIKTEIRIFNWSRFLSTYFDAYFRGGHFLAVSDNGKALTTQGSDSFVSRSGLSVQFSGVDYALTANASKVSLHHTYPTVAQFGPQLVRVFVEALFDANGLTPPAVSNSTACTEGLFTADECITSTGKDPDPVASSIAQLDMLASANEALATAATGAILRGINAAALNNEAVAEVLETFVGVNARKITEKVAYMTSLQGNAICPARAVPAPLRIE